MADGKVEIEVELDGKGAKGSAEKIGKQLGESVKQGVEPGAKSMGDSIAGFAKKAAGVLAAAGIADKLKDIGVAAVNAAAEVQAETASFEQIMGDYAGEAQNKMQAVADATGMADTRLTSSMTSMTAKFKGLGFGVEEATDLATRGLTLSADAAAFWDKTLDEANDSLNSFINGNYEGGEAIGLFANDTQMAQFAVQQGIVQSTKDWAALDEATKQATRLEYAEQMMALAGATGQAAREQDQFANQLANAKENARQMMAAIGDPILTQVATPALHELAKAAEGVADGFKDGDWSGAGMSVADGVAGIVDTIVSALPEFLSAGVELIGGVAIGIVKNIPAMVGNVASAIETGIPMLVTALMNVMTALVEALPDITQALVDAVPGIIDSVVAMLPSTLGALIDGVTGLVTALVDAIPDIIESLVAAIPTIVTTIATALAENAPLLVQGFVQLFSAFVTALPEIVMAIIPYIPQIVTTIVTTLLENLPVLVQGFIQLFLAFVQAFPQIIANIVPYLPMMVSTIVTTLIQNLPVLLQGFVQLFSAFVQAFPQIVSNIMPYMPQLVANMVSGLVAGVGQLAGAAVQLFNGFRDGIARSIPDIMSFVGSIPSKILGALGDLGGLLVDSGRAMLNGLAEGIRQGVGNAINAVKKGLSDIRSFFPFSPAKRGPFSGHGYTTFSGRAIMRDLGKGMESGAAAAAKAAEDALAKVQATFAAPTYAAPAMAAGSDNSRSYVVNVGDVALGGDDRTARAVERFFTDLGIMQRTGAY